MSSTARKTVTYKNKKMNERELHEGERKLSSIGGDGNLFDGMDSPVYRSGPIRHCPDGGVGTTSSRGLAE